MQIERVQARRAQIRAGDLSVDVCRQACADFSSWTAAVIDAAAVEMAGDCGGAQSDAGEARDRINESALVCVGEAMRRVEEMCTQVSIDDFPREGGSGSSADDGEMEWLMQKQQMLAQERALHATPRAGDRGLKASPRVDSRVLHAMHRRFLPALRQAELLKIVQCSPRQRGAVLPG